MGRVAPSVRPARAKMAGEERRRLPKQSSVRSLTSGQVGMAGSLAPQLIQETIGGSDGAAGDCVGGRDRVCASGRSSVERRVEPEAVEIGEDIFELGGGDRGRGAMKDGPAEVVDSRPAI